MKIVFFGDSITDALRDREHDFWLGSYGCGYVRDLTVKLMEEDKNIQVFNRGISGDRILELESRLTSDVLDIAPDLLSILVGVNDVWHGVNYNNGVDLKTFEKVYCDIIEKTFIALPKIKIVLLEPFVLEGNATREKYLEFMKVKEYAKVVKNIAKKYNVSFIKLQNVFDNATKDCQTSVYLSDGVHPTVLGAKLIANKWWEWYNKTK